MKAKITKESKKVLCLDDMNAVKEVRTCIEEDKLSNYTQTIARIASKTNDVFEIFRADAEIAKNSRIWDAYGDSKNLDVWITVYAYNSYVGFYEIGCYLTDIWEVTGDNSDQIRNRMFVLEYKRKVHMPESLRKTL